MTHPHLFVNNPPNKLGDENLYVYASVKHFLTLYRFDTEAVTPARPGRYASCFYTLGMLGARVKRLTCGHVYHPRLGSGPLVVCAKEKPGEVAGP